MGLFVTVEGPNGVGKSTFIKQLALELEQKNYSIYLTKEPSPTNFGNFVRQNESQLTGKTYAHLIATDRCYHIENFLLPSIDQYDIVLCDRYVESSLVLQQFDGVDLDYIWKLNQDFIIPDLSILLLSSVEMLEQRLKQRSVLTHFEQRMSRKEELELYSKARVFIESKGFNVRCFTNNYPQDIEYAIENTLFIIQHLRGE